MIIPFVPARDRLDTIPGIPDRGGLLERRHGLEKLSYNIELTTAA